MEPKLSEISTDFIKLGRMSLYISNVTATNLKFRHLRRRCDSKLFRNFVKYENTKITFNPISDKDPNIGGTVAVVTREFNFSMMKFFLFNQYGYYTHDKLVFGKFANTYDN